MAIVAKSEEIPCGARILSTNGAKKVRRSLSRMLGKWDIVGLLNGKVDGEGYGKQIMEKYCTPFNYLIIQTSKQ